MALTAEQACADHNASGYCEDNTRAHVVCDILGSTCNNCGASEVYCSEMPVFKSSCNCGGNKDKWVIDQEWVEKEAAK